MINCAHCKHYIHSERVFSTYANHTSYRAIAGEHTGDVYWCDKCGCLSINDFLDKAVRVYQEPVKQTRHADKLKETFIELTLEGETKKILGVSGKVLVNINFITEIYDRNEDDTWVYLVNSYTEEHRGIYVKETYEEIKQKIASART